MLRTGIAASVHNFEFKVALMRLMRDLGAVTEAHALFRQLDIKHIQYESLSHELQDPLRRISLSRHLSISSCLCPMNCRILLVVSRYILIALSPYLIMSLSTAGFAQQRRTACRGIDLTLTLTLTLTLFHQV